MKYDFDKIIERRGTDCVKHDNMAPFFGREDLVPLWVADMDFEVCPEISDALSRRVDHHVYGYACNPKTYYPAILSWIKRRHHLDVTADEVTYVPGIVRGIAFVINYFCRKGDKVLIQPPVYHPFRHLAEGNGFEVVTNPLIALPDGRYRMDLDNLEAVAERERPRLMVLCNPHNPIGLQWSADELRRVAEIADRHGIIVISDEIHSDLMAPGVEHIPYLAVSDAARRTGIMMGAPSKTFNIPGLISSWCVIPNPEIREGFFNWLTVNEFNVPTFFSTIATIAAYTYGEEWLDECIAYLRCNIEHVLRRLPEVSGGRLHGVSPDASFLVWVDCRDLGLGHKALLQFFADAGLALNDGAGFGLEGAGFMRLNVACPRSVLDDSLSRLEATIGRLGH